ncbi:hypothetical protein OAV62_02065 [bacterium]|nr:hypothetical protein [bacterium]
MTSFEVQIQQLDTSQDDFEQWSDQVEQFRKIIQTTVDGKDLPFAVNDILNRLTDPFFPKEARDQHIQMIQQVLGVELTKIAPEEEVLPVVILDDNEHKTLTTTTDALTTEEIDTRQVVLKSITVLDAEERVYNFELAPEERLQAIRVLCENDPVYFEEIIAKLLSMHEFSGNYMVNAYIREICRVDTVPFLERLTAITSLCEADKHSGDAYKILGEMCQTRDLTIPLVVYLEKVFYLIKHDPAHTRLFDNFLDDCSIDEKLRYAYVVKSKISVDFPFFVAHMWKLIQSKSFTHRFKIICCSNFVTMDEIVLSPEERETIMNLLCEWMDDTTLDMNIRADAADIVLNFGEDLTERAKKTLMDMGSKGLGVLSTIYDNKQNAHFTNTEANVSRIMKQLNALDVEPSTTPFTEIQENLFNSYFDVSRTDDDKEKFEFSLFRIIHQVGKIVGGYSLQDIFLLVYGYIEANRYQKFIEKRLVEELIDMSETCTTGYYSRLLNALSGYGGFQFEIDWETQIQANLVGRLRACILDDEKIDDVLEELTVESFVDRPELRRIYQVNISRIMEDMRTEFVEYIDANEFDLYLRKALLNFEGHRFDET